MLAAWLENTGPSFLYQESTAYLLSLLTDLYRQTRDPCFEMEARRTAQSLAASIQAEKGCGRNNRRYLFDSAICLRSFMDFCEIFPGAKDLLPGSIIEQTRQQALELLNAHAACHPANGNGDRGHWSREFSVHLFKAFSLLYPALQKPRLLSDLDSQIQRMIKERYRDGLFFVNPDRTQAYLHSHCYAVEGLLMLNGRMGEFCEGVVRQAAEKLAWLQTDDGGILNWWPAREEARQTTDVAAQAVRIWQCVDPAAYSDNIIEGLRFLEAMSDPGGGVRYCRDVRHLNSWATIFTIQALIWQETGTEVRWLV